MTVILKIFGLCGKTTFLSCVKLHVKSKVLASRKNMPWMNSDLRRLLRKQNRLHRLFKTNEINMGIDINIFEHMLT